MSYQVIARKYRPQRFSDVVGQEHVTRTLSNAIAQNRIAHAYLFVGPRGTGKTTIARIFAKGLNCTGGPRVDFDDSDPRCREIAEGRSMDVLEIDGASNRGIEEIRELRETVKYAPATSKFKIYIIDEVHMLTKEAFNALLKTLEEPPAHVKFMFATTEPEKVLPTILSRCQRFDLRRIPAALIVSHLGHIATQEGVQIDDAALHAIARGADGGMRDAESTLDQLISFCGDRIVESDVLSMFGLTARSQILSLAEALLDGKAEKALRELNDLAKQGKDLARLLSDLLGHIRNLLIYEVSGADLQLLEVSEAEAESLGVQSKLLDSGGVTRILEVLTESEGRLREAASKKIFVEVTLLRAIQARNAVSIDAVLNRLQDLRPQGGSAGASPAPAAEAPAARPATAATRARGQASAVQATISETQQLRETPTAAADSSGDLETLWKNLLDAIGRASPFARSSLVQAHPVCFEANLLTIGFDPEFADQLEFVDNPRNQTLIQTKLDELGFPRARVKFVTAESPANRSRSVPQAQSEQAEPAATEAPLPRPPEPAQTQAPRRPEPVPFNKEDFRNDPLIQKALEVFKGQIVEVRS